MSVLHKRMSTIGPSLCASLMHRFTAYLFIDCLYRHAIMEDQKCSIKLFWDSSCKDESHFYEELYEPKKAKQIIRCSTARGQ